MFKLRKNQVFSSSEQQSDVNAKRSLKLEQIKKDYTTGETTIQALKGVSLEFRENEFVSILGQSGCGKTTLLNIIGGLDKYTSGDLIINGKSTKDFNDSDWDTYRNHSIGFVFQSYNLIPHQTVLSNVELALTLSGVSPEERKKRAIAVLEKVGLGDQLYKKPNQMSGGQMQRVAIARALVNDPDILLADEPTGALDSETSIQIMDILKEISKEKLIIMVTHNPELAEQYSNRIIRLLDGNIISDSNPYESKEISQIINDGKKKKSMSFLTALSLSLNNLLTKKGRTFLTAFAGSIGIIGIALILSVSNGVKNYITSVEESTMSSYPIQIHENTMDTMTLLNSLMSQNTVQNREKGKIYSNDIMLSMMDAFSKGTTSNNLTAFKNHIENTTSISNSATDIKYIYKANLNAYTIIKDSDGNTTYRRNLSGISELMAQIGLGDMFGSSSQNSMMSGAGAWSELVGNDEYIKSQYKLIDGDFPKNENEIILIVGEDNLISDFILYTIGLRDIIDLKTYVDTRKDSTIGNEFEIKPVEYTFEEILGYEFKIIPDSEKYTYENGIIKACTPAQINEKLKNARTLKIVGIVTPSDSSASSSAIGSIGYKKELMDSIINDSNLGNIINVQQQNKETNLLTGIPFIGFNADCTSLRSFIKSIPAYAAYEPQMTDSQIIEIFKSMLGDEMKLILDDAPYGGYTQDNIIELKTKMASITDAGAKAILPVILMESNENFIKIINSMIESDDYNSLLSKLGYVDKSKPSSILIYPKDFEAKDVISEAIEQYNLSQSEADKITYTDTVGLLMSSVTTIVNAISYVLIAFVAISLIVSSIMIGIITYISVLERTKEIGILRAIGASKKDISRVFNAETLIVGFIAGAIGILVSLLFILIINIILHSLTGIATLNASLPIGAAIFLVAVSMILTLFAGLIPSRIASKKDPVIALRTE